MTRSILRTAIFGLFVAACGSSNNGSGSTHECGDGVLDTGEQCDDGNTASGDGCSSVCKLESSSGGVCGDGTIQVATEQCDDGNTVSGDGCSATCQTETVNPTTCGNGTLETGETCDDGNTTAADGCSATCTVESGYTCTGTPSVCTMGSTAAGTCAAPIAITLTGTATKTGSAMGDTTNTTSQVEGDCDAYTDDSIGNDQIFTFTLTAASPVDITVTSQDFDPNIRLMTTACDVSTQVTDTNETDGCSDVGSGPTEDLSYTNLAAGTYYVVVDTYDDTTAGPFTVSITAGSLCGNNHLNAGEECDDGNTTAGDRCSATCTLEFDTAEVEPNNTAVQAQVITPAHHIIKGSLTAGDADLYKFTLTAATKVEIETYDSMNPDHVFNGVSTLTNLTCSADNTDLLLFDSTGDVTDDASALYEDFLDGDYADDFSANCSYLGPLDSDGDTTQGVLQPGTYTFKVQDYNADAETRYLVDVKFTPMTSTTAVAPGVGDLKINEVMLADNLADTNCDMSTSDTVDEFVELVNVTTHPLDLTGVTISDSMAVRHTFASTNTGTGSLTLQPGKAMVVWGGGAPACAGVTNFFIASTGSLGLNDGGDTVTVASGTTTVATATFGASTIQKSWNLDPDLTGTTYALHDAVTGHVGAFTPGKKNDGTAF